MNSVIKVSYCKVTYFGSSPAASMADPAFEAEVNDIEVRHPTVIPEAGIPPPSPSCAHARRPFDASCSQANLKQSLISKAKPCVGTQKIFLRAPGAALHPHALTPQYATRAAAAAADEAQTLKLAFKKFDEDNDGYVSYPQFVGALEKFGIYGSPGARGLFDRYHPDAGTSDAPLSFTAFSEGLFAPASRKPPVPARRDRTPDVMLQGPLDMRQSPANSWATSVSELSPSKRPVRVHSIANPAWRDQHPPQWNQVDQRDVGVYAPNVSGRWTPRR